MKTSAKSMFHVAGLLFVTPMGTWRLACPHANQGTRYWMVHFVPSWARVAYRSGAAS